jgi:flagellar motor switch protein FliM
MAEDELLSQEEIDALLNGQGGEKKEADTGGGARISAY